MSFFIARNDVQEASVSAVIVRADGTRQELGIVSYHHKSPLKRLVFKAKKLFKKLIR